MRARVLLAALTITLGLATATPADAGQEHLTRIVWTQVLDDEFTTARIVSAHPDGSGFRALTHPAAGEFDIDAVISPDGSRVAVERDLADGSAQIIIVGADGRGEHALDLGCVDPCALDAAPGWTADGRRITFTPVIGPFDQVNDSARSAVLHTANLDGSGVRRLSEPGIDGAFEDYRARFAPGGKYLIFVRVRNRDIKAAVFRMRPDGSQVRQLTPWRLDADLPDVSLATHGPTKDLVVFETFGHGPPEGSQQDIATVPANLLPAGRLHQQDPLRDQQRCRPRHKLQPVVVAERNADRVHQRAPTPRAGQPTDRRHLDGAAQRQEPAAGLALPAVRVPTRLGSRWVTLQRGGMSVCNPPLRRRSLGRRLRRIRRRRITAHQDNR